MTNRYPITREDERAAQVRDTRYKLVSVEFQQGQSKRYMPANIADNPIASRLAQSMLLEALGNDSRTCNFGQHEVKVTKAAFIDTARGREKTIEYDIEKLSNLIGSGNNQLYSDLCLS